MDLDSLGIYGSDIWMLYKDVCGENLATSNDAAIEQATKLTKEFGYTHAGLTIYEGDRLIHQS